jgi:glycerol-3-phosphate acyltransferase PlsY
MSGAAIVATSYLVGSIPFSQIAAELTTGTDLREVGSGTVSGTNLHQVAGFGPLAAAGVLELAKGAVGPLLAGKDRPVVRALAAGAAVAGHNWSPFLRGAGGRGISPATGALAATAPVGAAVLLGGMTAGRLAGETAIGSAVADLALVPVVRAVHRSSWPAAAAVLAPMIVKRVTGNRLPPPGSGALIYLNRLLYDRDHAKAS